MTHALAASAVLPPAGTLDRIHRLWNDLPDFGAARIEEAMLQALRELAALVDAQQAYWLGTVRLAEHAGDDLARGWRPAAIRFLHPQEFQRRNFKEHKKRIERGAVDPGIAANVARAGEFRVNVKSEMIGPDWFKSDFYRQMLAPFGVGDTLHMATPIGEDMESWFCFERIGAPEAVDTLPAFGPAERALLEMAGRPLKWLHRQILLHYGLTLAEKPLTATERRLLAGLLGGGSEADIAAELQLSPTTVHTYATRLYRKFNVRGRTGLTTLWLGR